jgi:CubicO group peptidase (beta-lactamase class C family)
MWTLPRAAARENRSSDRLPRQGALSLPSSVSLERTLTLRNWFDPPHNRSAFCRVRELVPTACIRRGEGDPAPLPSNPKDFDHLQVVGDDGRPTDLADYLRGSYTDGFIVVLDGVVLYERYWGSLQRATTHLLHSVSKSYCAALAGVLIGQDKLAPYDQVTELVPDLRGTSFDGATVRHLLDMRAGTFCPEDYDTTDAGAPFWIYALQAGYVPLDGLEPMGILGHMRTLTNARPHGGAFEYRSVLTNVLARVLETVADTPYPELLGRELWQPLRPEYDAEIMLDPFGFPPVEGGMCCTLRDLARLGETYRQDGQVDGTAVIPARWVWDTCHGDEDTLTAYAQSGSESEFPATMYRNGWWVIDRDHTLAALGIHGQMVYVDRSNRLTVARLASEPVPDCAPRRVTLLRAAEVILAAAA